jgi:methylmalonyl-CoA/ethylmalonyl-CoA epimerase
VEVECVPDSGLAQIIEKRGEGIDSIAFHVDELDAPISELESRGARIFGREGRIAWIHPKNPLSMPIELLRRED